jgi:mRNA interferase MazF
MVVRQGDVFWVDLGLPFGSEPGYRRPAVVVQGDAFNDTAIRTIVVCFLTSRLRYAEQSGNVALAKGEAELPKRSVVNVTQLATVDRARLVEKIGSVSRDRLRQVLDGIHLLLAPAPGL